MIIPPLPDAFFLLDEPSFAAPAELLVADPAFVTVVPVVPEPPATTQQQAGDAPAVPHHLPVAAPDPAPDVSAPILTPAPPQPVEAASGADTAAPGPTAPAPDPLPVVEPASVPEIVTASPTPSPPAFDVPPEDAFPSLADLDAILAAHAGPPPGPDLAEREALLALLGLDPAIAADADLFDATIAALPDPDAEQVVAGWMTEAGVGDPPADWHLG